MQHVTPDNFDHQASRITATIVPGPLNGQGTNYQVAQSPNNLATVSVTNQILPVLSVVARSVDAAEGDDLVFEIRSTSTTPVSFGYTLGETGNFVEPGQLGQGSEVTTDNINAPQLVHINTKTASNRLDPDSLVTLSLDSGVVFDRQLGRFIKRYAVGASNSASILVSDANVPAGGLSITALDNTIIEGESAEFQIRSLGIFTQATEVLVEYSNDTPGLNFIAQRDLTRRVNIKAGQRSVNFQVPTEDLARSGRSGTITATLRPNGNQYTIAPGYGQQTITVNSNDVHLTAAVSSVNYTEVIEGDTTTEFPKDDDGNDIRERYESGATSCDFYCAVGPLSGQYVTHEKGVIIFEITLSQHSRDNSYTFPSEGVIVDHTITQTGGNFIYVNESSRDSPTGKKSIKFTSLGTKQIIIPTQVDPENNPGEITISIDNDDNSPVLYRVATSPNHKKTVTIQDNGETGSTLSLNKLNIEGTDLPIETITEGDPWGVKIDIDPPATYPFRIGLTVNQSGADFLWPGGDGITTKPKEPGHGTKVIAIERGESV